MSMNLESFVQKFKHSKKAGAGYVVQCPAHEDDKPSLSIGIGKDGKIVMFCHAGCPTSDIVDALGMKMGDLFPPKPGGSGLKPHIIESYDYCDVDGTLLYQVLRKSDKSFLQRRPDGAGGWTWKVAKKVKRVPYLLPTLIGKTTVYVVEGEKDANNLQSIGVPATCNAGGAGKWGVSESKRLKDAGVARVIILPDNDGPGVAHANEVAAKCKAQGISVTIAQLPGLQPKGDVSDWLASGKTKDDLEAFVKTIPYVIAAPAATSTVENPNGEPVVTTDPEPPPVDLPPDTLPNPTKYAPPNGDGIPYDVGAAEAFCDRYGDRIRFDHAQQRWLIWDGHYWRPDDDGEIRRMARRHVDLWQQEAIRAVTYPQRKALVNFTLHLDKRSAMENMIASATWQQPVATDGSQWDTDQWVLGVPNGVIDLRTGELREGKREDWITKQSRVIYNPDASCPRWLQFLDEIMEGDAEIIGYIRRALGYSLTGDMREQVFFLCIGSGANGKSIFLDTLEYVWGDYAHRANMRIFVGTGNEEKYHLAELDGRRLILASETKPNTRMNEHTVKNWTGGESQSAERKFGQPFTFRPVGKLWLGTNHNPRVVDDSYGFWRRVRTLEFNRTFTGSAEDRSLRDKLQHEAEGILAWAVQGCLEWQELGMMTPQRIIDAVDVYQVQEDPLQEFFVERCVLEPESIITFSAVFAAYNKWCDDQGIRSGDRMSRRAMGNNLKRRFQQKDVEGVRKYLGLELKPTYVGDGYAKSGTFNYNGGEDE